MKQEIKKYLPELLIIAAGMILFLVFLLLLTESFLAMRFGMRKG